MSDDQATPEPNEDEIRIARIRQEPSLRRGDDIDFLLAQMDFWKGQYDLQQVRYNASERLGAKLSHAADKLRKVIADVQSDEPEKPEKIFLVVQQGGSSGEWYAASYDSPENAKDAIVGHDLATYRAIGPFEIPDAKNESDWLEVIGDACGAAATNDYAEVTDEEREAYAEEEGEEEE